MKKEDIKHKWDDKQRVEFAKQVEMLYEASHPSWKKILSLAFLKGIATGLGVFLGGTIVVALLLWILSGLGRLPFLDDVSRSARDTIEQGSQ
ncbi:MAG TPA: DUF5665 domain-containing protein [Candidatus Saccharimonadales bacterium]|nr:DUF5665 domain-containing protein [Candidatus Saccharimonadales bacterium]